VKEITNDGTVIEHNGQEQTLSGMDHIVLACGTRVVENLSDKIRDTVPEIHVIGDAKQPRRALEAIREGARVGRAVWTDFAHRPAFGTARGCVRYLCLPQRLRLIRAIRTINREACRIRCAPHRGASFIRVPAKSPGPGFGLRTSGFRAT
jgi:hypothetical protein